MPMTPYPGSTEPEAPLERASRQLERLHHEADDVRSDVFDLLDELGAVDILREHAPPSQRFLLDRLEIALRLVDRLERDIQNVEAKYERITMQFEMCNEEQP
jgi:hypothetical protein